MLKNKILEKLLAVFLVFTLTFANFAFVSKSYAVSFAEIFGGKSSTGNKNVEFEAYFGAEDEKSTSVISDVNNKELEISMDLNVKDEGYLKDAKIEITKGENEEELGFELKEKTELEESIRNIENNTVYLNQINKSSEVKIQIPIEYKNENYVKEEKALSESVVKFSGTYVDKDGDEKELEKEVELEIAWKDEREVKLEEEPNKYISYGEGIIFQTVERIDNVVEENVNTLPVEETEIEIDVPTIKDQKPSKITVVANSTEATNGLGAGEVKFGRENWEYNEEENKLRIKVSNEKQMVEINESEGEYLQEGEKKQEERLYNGSGIDEYLVTYTYENLKVEENEKLEAKTKAVARMTTLSGVESDENVNVVVSEKENTYSLEGTTGEIVSLHLNNNKEEISKAYAYINYNNAGRYEVEIPSEMIVNISYKDIVESMEVKDESTVYVDKAGSEIATNDTYYKSISVSKENFDSILGEKGEIKVKDEVGNIISVINSASTVDENGNIVVGFAEKYSRLSFEMSKPVEDGNIVISTVKAVSDVSVDKATYSNLDKIVTKSRMEAKYSYVETPINIGEVSAETKLTDTTTEATLTIDRESLSTIEPNTDVEMRVELNNAKESSDVYGHSDFEIELPEYVENIELTNVSLLYGEGLQLTGSSVEGRIIRFSIDGRQDGINSGVLTNGTNIVLNANINVNMYAPAKEEKIVLRYTNSEATNYVDGGAKEIGIEYSAPTGLVAVNSISNYDAQGSVTTSIRQGKKDGILAVYNGSVTPRTELIVMNNNKNTIGNISILGRIPFTGVKDLVSNEELKTTLDMSLTNLIESNEQNRGSFNIYYSENGEATRDLGDENNGWTLEPADINLVKSYLIVPAEQNYEMAENEILRFAYNFVVPENLTHNENLYGTFGVYYRNNAELSQEFEFEVADLVGLTTGAGPEIEVSISKDIETVKENEEFGITVSVSNVGENVAENVNIEFPIPSGSAYSRYEIDADNANVSEEENRVVVTLERMEIGQNVKLVVYLIANPIEVSGEVDQYVKETTPTVNVTAKDLGTVLTDTSNTIKIEFAEFYISEAGPAYEKIEEPGNQISFSTTIINSSTETKNNVVVTKKLPKEISFISATEGGTYDETTRTITWNLGNMDKLTTAEIGTDLAINDFEDDLGIKDVSISSSVKADNSDDYKSNEVIVTIGKPILKITQTTENENTYIKEGDPVNYTFVIRNEGGITARSLKIKDEIPDGIAITNINYTVAGKEINRYGMFKDGVELEVNIVPGEDWILKLSGKATSIGASDEKSATNYAVLSSDTVKEVRSNSITHIIEASDTYGDVEQGSSSNSSATSASSSRPVQTRTYKIEGSAWEDENQDGMRNSGEKSISSIPVKLVNSETGEVLQKITTDSQGKYTFSGVANGNYLVLFEHDSSKYRVTAYQKEGVASNANSDVILTTIEKNGQTVDGAVTDVIVVNGGSVSNIDIGLMLSSVFDLQLEKAISKVTVQTSNGTTTEEYNNVALAKTDIGAKYLSGATVFVEYTFAITNIGDYSGYAKKIVDYIPEGMTFNSTLEANKDWYTGSDGNLYTNALANRELKSGATAIVKLVLTKQTTEENIGIINNIAEIYEDYNTYGIKDINSTPANKAQGENDMSRADIVIGVRTGEVFVYVSIIIITILLGTIALFVLHNRIVVAKRKGGV